MLLTDRRSALLNVALMGVDLLWCLPLALLFWPALPAAQFFVLFYGAALLWMLLLDLFERAFADSGRYRGAMLGTLLVSSLLAQRVFLYADVPLGDLSWLLAVVQKLPQIAAGPSAELVLLVLCVILWLHAAWSPGRNLTSLAVERSFKWSGAFLLLSAGFYERFARLPLLIFLVLFYLALGMIVLTLVHSDERASRTHTAGLDLSAGRWLQFLMLVAGFVLLAGVLLLILPGRVRAVLAWFPQALDFAARVFLVALFLLTFAVVVVGRWFTDLLNLGRGVTPASDTAAQQQAMEELIEYLEQGQGRDLTLPPWLEAFLPYIPLLLVGAVALLIFVLVVRRVRRRSRRAVSESEERIAFSPGDLWRRGVARLRDLGDMVQRFGVGRQLLAAISVQNIYANLCRIAAQKGQPRPLSMPAELYLPLLIAVFDGHAEALGRITEAYMRVHYGDQPITAGELLRLQGDYARLRAAVALASPPPGGK